MSTFVVLVTFSLASSAAASAFGALLGLFTGMDNPEKNEKLSPVSNEDSDEFLGVDNNANRKLAFEDIIESLGSFGNWQRVIFVLISSADVFGAMCMLIPVFIGDTPRWRCARFENENDTWWNTTVDGLDKLDLEVCERSGTKCVEFQFMDDFTSFIGDWSLVCDKDYLSDTMSSVQMGGLMVGAGIFGQLSDTFGRKRMYYLVFALQIGSGMLSAASVNWQMYAVCRFLVGVGFGAYMVINCAYPLEFVGQRWRMLCGTIGFWAIGIIMLSGIAYLIRDWRYLTAATTVSGVIFFLTWFVVPESPRWLVQERRFEEAQEILQTIAKKNNRPPPTLSVLKRFAADDEAERKELKKYSYLDLFRRWKYAKRTLIMALLWFTSFLAYYEISFNLKNLSGDRYLNMFLGGSVDLAAMLFVILLLNRIGRRISMAIFLGVVMITLLCIVLLISIGQQGSLENVTLALALTGKACGLAAVYVVQILSAELFPTVIRTVGLGFGSVAGRFGTMLAPLLVYVGGIYKLAPYIAVTALAGLSLPVIFLLPETNGQPLEDAYDAPAQVCHLLEDGETTPNKDQANSNSTKDVTWV